MDFLKKLKFQLKDIDNFIFKMINISLNKSIRVNFLNLLMNIHFELWL